MVGCGWHLGAGSWEVKRGLVALVVLCSEARGLTWGGSTHRDGEEEKEKEGVEVLNATRDGGAQSRSKCARQRAYQSGRRGTPSPSPSPYNVSMYPMLVPAGSTCPHLVRGHKWHKYRAFALADPCQGYCSRRSREKRKPLRLYAEINCAWLHRFRDQRLVRAMSMRGSGISWNVVLWDVVRPRSGCRANHRDLHVPSILGEGCCVGGELVVWPRECRHYIGCALGLCSNSC